jgi:DNA primase
MSEPRANFIPEDAIRSIRESCSIVDVISDYVSLKKTGINHRGLCPFHSEKTPSFFVNQSRGTFHCFGCSEYGDIFTFLMKRENMSFVEAVRHLAQRCGIALPERRLSPQDAARLEERGEFFAINAEAARIYSELLQKDPRAERARQYLAGRGMSAETIEAFEIGFAPDAWDTLTGKLRAQGISLDKAQEIGLLSSRKDGGSYDRFRNRIIFPIRNSARQVIGFGGRIIDDGEPKYLNSPESAIYSKRASLYGLPLASQHISRENKVLVVEGYLDAITLHQAGILNVVAALGTALSEQHIQLLRRYSSNIIMVFDADAAGEKAMIRSLEPFLAAQLAPRFILLPEGEDPDSFVKKNGPENLKDYMDKAGLVLDYAIEKTIQNHVLADPAGKVAACDAVLVMLENLSDPLERQLYVQKLARRLGLQEQQVSARVRGSRAGNAPGPELQEPEKRSDFHRNAEKLILQLMIMHPETVAMVRQTAILDDFADPALQHLCLYILEYSQGGERLDLKKIMDDVSDDSEKKLLAEAAYAESLEGPAQKILSDCIRNIRLKKNSRARERVTALMKQAEASRDESAAREHQRARQDLLQEKRQILNATLDGEQV